MKLKLFATSLLFTALLWGCGGSNNSEQSENESNENAQIAEDMEIQESALAFNPDSVGVEPIFDIVTSMGTIRVKLYEDTPKHRSNFIRLASERFYDGILFHRIIKDFMIQTGDPNTKDPNCQPQQYGSGGPGYEIPAEIVEGHKHIKGALAAARKGDTANPERKSSGSQFYIVHNPEACSHLDGAYTVFGETISGFDIIDAIATVPTGAVKNELPNSPVRILSIQLVKE